MATQKKQTNNTRKNTPAVETRPPRRREIGAFIALLFGIFTFLAYFTETGWLLLILRMGISGLIGWGFFVVSPVLFGVSAVLAFHRGRAVRLRVASWLALPVLLGTLVHLFGTHGDFPSGFAMVGELWTSGRYMSSGGVISGLFAIGAENMLSIVGAVIVFIFLLGLALYFICNKGFTELTAWFRNRERIEYEVEPEPEPAFPPPQPIKPPKPRRKPTIDIPMDGEPPAAPPNPTPYMPQPGPLARLFGKPPISLDKPNVASPDQVLASDPATPSAPPRSPFSKQFDIPIDTGNVPDLRDYQSEPTTKSPPPAPVASEGYSSVEIEMPPTGKVKPQEVAEATVDIARSVAEHMAVDLSDYTYPPVTLLHRETVTEDRGVQEEVARNAERLSAALLSFGVDASIATVTRGPSVTRYELELEAGIKLNKLTNLSDDLALSLGASGVRIAPIPDKISTVGIEVPNKLVRTVYLREVLESRNFTSSEQKLAFALGMDIAGSCMVGNISKLPHLLIAGTTGSGKSVTMNSIILSVLYKARPDEVKFIMIDPKMVEFGVYNGIPHLLIPVVTDPKKAAGALQWAVTEMLKRYKLFSETGARDLTSYNRIAAESEEHEPFPQLVVVIDELADLMLVASREVEESICRVAQMGRASGIHLVIATQRPSADVITGLMKANIPSRIALSVSSAMESRIILDAMGAEKLVGNGDMLYKPVGANKPTRIQGTFVSDREREDVIAFLKESGGTAEYDDSVDRFIETAATDKSADVTAAADGGDNDYDELFDDAASVVLDLGQASVSMLQRKLKLGYSRAARLMDQLEEAGLVGPHEGSKPRQILLSREEWLVRTAGSADEVALAETASLAESNAEIDTPPWESDNDPDLPPEDMDDEPGA